MVPGQARARKIEFILALADDMTGALEVGAKFRAAGMETMVAAVPVPGGTAPVVVLDTETRHSDPEAARREILRFVSLSASLPSLLIYKKTDSTLRGNIGAELLALGELYPNACAGYAPAYPALGRTVQNGHVYVHGRRISETEFARDALNPVRSSSVADLLHPGLDCTIFDGLDDADLTEAARMILGDPRMRIAAGPAAMAEALAALIDLPRCPPPALPRVRTCLVMNGSRHHSSARQVRHLNAAGWLILNAPLEAGLTAEHAASRNARHLAGETARERPDGVFVIGGDTAFAFLRELGFPPMQPVAEIVPGVPLTMVSAAGYPLLLITKAGGFGDDDVMTHVHQRLNP